MPTKWWLVPVVGEAVVYVIGFVCECCKDQRIIRYTYIWMVIVTHILKSIFATS